MANPAEGLIRLRSVPFMLRLQKTMERERFISASDSHWDIQPWTRNERIRMGQDNRFHEQRLASRLGDKEFRKEFEQAQSEIKQIDEVIRELDHLRMESRMSKAELARRIGKNPASVRRLFTAESNPELGTIAAIANVLGAQIRVEPSKRKRTSPRSVAV